MGKTPPRLKEQGRRSVGQGRCRALIRLEKKTEDPVAGKTMKALVLRKHGGLDELQLVGDYPSPR